MPDSELPDPSPTALSRIVDAVDDGILCVGASGAIDYVNRRGMEILGRQTEDIIGRRVDSFMIGREDADGVVRIARGDGEHRWIRLVMRLIGDGGHQSGTVATLTDITEKHARDIESRTTARELHELYHDAPCGYHSLDAQGIVVQINDTELTWLGYARDEIVGRMPFIALLTERCRDRFQRNFERLKARGTMRDYEYEMRRRDGTSFPVLWSSTVIPAVDGRFAHTRATVFDITKEKWAAEEVRRYADSLRAASRRLVEVQEAERRALANALHDLVGQKLTALSINLNIVKTQAERFAPGAIDGRLADSMRLVEETIESIRDVMAELRPAVLDDYGLVPVLHWYAEAFSKRTGLATEVTSERADRRLPAAVEEAFFRIAQEALANVAKYAGAKRATITMRSGARHVSLAISDDGRGFDLLDANRPSLDHGWGLMLMRERASAVGADLDVDSAPGRGTTVTVRWQGEAP